MDERKINLPMEFFFMKFVNDLKSLAIPYELIQDNENYYAFTEIFSVHGEGANIDQAITDMFAAMRASVKAFCDDFAYWYRQNPFELPYVLKVLLSSDEELKSCLIRKANYEDF